MFGTTRRMNQWYFCPAEYTLSQNLKLTLTLNLGFVGLGLGLGLDLGSVLGFVLVCTPLGKNIVGSFLWSYPLLFSVLCVETLNLGQLNESAINTPCDTPACQLTRSFFSILLDQNAKFPVLLTFDEGYERGKVWQCDHGVNVPKPALLWGSCPPRTIEKNKHSQNENWKRKLKSKWATVEAQKNISRLLYNIAFRNKLIQIVLVLLSVFQCTA